MPTQFVLPDAPREGLVVNLAQLRVYYFPKPPKLKKGEVDDGMRTVITHPIGIGKIGWETPLGSTKVVSKQKNPTWTPPLSVRKEHKENGDPLPARGSRTRFNAVVTLNRGSPDASGSSLGVSFVDGPGQLAAAAAENFRHGPFGLLERARAMTWLCCSPFDRRRPFSRNTIS